GVDHLVGPAPEGRVELLGIELDADAVDVALAESGDVEGRLAQGLGGNHPGVGDRHPTGQLVALDDGDPLAEVGSLDGGLLPGRPRADDDQVVVLDHQTEAVASVAPRSPRRVWARPASAGAPRPMK